MLQIEWLTNNPFIGQIIVAVGMTYAMVRIGVSILNRQAKGLQVKQLLNELGFKNFKVTDLNELTQEGFGRLIVVMRELKPASGWQQQIQELAALSQMGLGATAGTVIPGVKKPESSTTP